MKKLTLSMLAAASAALALGGCHKSPASKDAGTPASCNPDDAPQTAGCEPGCAMPCVDGFQTKICQPPSGPCPLFAHADSLCLSGGKCARGPCELEYFDFDPSIPGCETRCKGRECTLADGKTVTLSNDPLHEQSAAFHALSSGASFGDQVQKNGSFQNIGTLGEMAVGSSSSDGGYTNHGGFLRASQRP